MKCQEEIVQDLGAKAPEPDAGWDTAAVMTAQVICSLDSAPEWDADDMQAHTEVLDADGEAGADSAVLLPIILHHTPDLTRLIPTPLMKRIPVMLPPPERPGRSRSHRKTAPEKRRHDSC